MNRFVVFCQARTGTHLLRTSLEQHPGVRCAWEPFNDKAVHHFPYDLTTPARSILRMLWREEHGVQAAGFPLHLGHGRGGRAWSEVWELLAEDSSLARLHLYRRNLLEQLVSHTLALRTGNWMVEADQAVSQPSAVTFALDAKHCHDWFASTAEAVLAQQRSMPDNALTITYEDLAQGLNAVLARVFRRLGVTPVKVQQKIRKQGRPATKTLENFEQLRDAFSATPWQSFFDGMNEHTWDAEIFQIDGLPQ
ncbi:MULTISPECIES: hypothetical protein [Sphaerimonospora]|uniref:Sulfotransferase family protein n=2 Tax=Sphaerimonospora TaxID=1792303 RepID=A0A8J3RGR3_9ACTN|nr:hypothetical protein [Sphaerimonospora thailandensis]GIH72058.1 hypothetical protein Mth01_43110 [Sphaerimonospora thailandensis]